MTYGAIGQLIGHEIIHGFDDQGGQHDENGDMVDWWEPETREKYFSKAQCIVNQYNNYTAEEVGLKVSLIFHSRENISVCHCHNSDTSRDLLRNQKTLFFGIKIVKVVRSRKLDLRQK